MKNLRILSPVEVLGQHRAEGEIVEGVDNSLAAQLVESGRAVDVPSIAPQIRIPDPEPESRDPEAEQADVDKPATRKRKA
jgi:hypothetical protein